MYIASSEDIQKAGSKTNGAPRYKQAVRNNVKDVAKSYVLAGGRYQLLRLNSVVYGGVVSPS